MMASAAPCMEIGVGDVVTNTEYCDDERRPLRMVVVALEADSRGVLLATTRRLDEELKCPAERLVIVRREARPLLCAEEAIVFRSDDGAWHNGRIMELLDDREHAYVRVANHNAPSSSTSTMSTTTLMMALSDVYATQAALPVGDEDDCLPFLLAYDEPPPSPASTVPPHSCDELPPPLPLHDSTPSSSQAEEHEGYALEAVDDSWLADVFQFDLDDNDSLVGAVGPDARRVHVVEADADEVSRPPLPLPPSSSSTSSSPPTDDGSDRPYHHHQSYPCHAYSVYCTPPNDSDSASGGERYYYYYNRRNSRRAAEAAGAQQPQQPHARRKKKRPASQQQRTRKPPPSLAARIAKEGLDASAVADFGPLQRRLQSELIAFLRQKRPVEEDERVEGAHPPLRPPTLLITPTCAITTTPIATTTTPIAEKRNKKQSNDHEWWNRVPSTLWTSAVLP